MNLNLTNPRYKIALINCDASISHSNSKIMQLISNCAKNQVESVVILDHHRIKYTQSYKCTESDFLKNKAQFEAHKYTNLYRTIDLGYVDNRLYNIDAEFVHDLFEINPTYSSRANIILVTCSTTDVKIIEQVQDITYNSPFGTFIHLHVETGNPNESGALYAAMSQNGKVMQPYTHDFKYLDVGNLASREMLSQAGLGGTTTALALANIILFDYLPLPVTRFNFNSMSIGLELPNTPPMEPIKLLQPRKVYKKKGKNKKSRKSSKKIHVFIGGTGATGSFFLSEILQQLNQSPDDIGNIVLVDGDIIEAKNLANQRCTRNEVGMYKVIAQANRYNQVFPNLNIKAYNKFIFDLNEDILKDILGLPTLKDQTIICFGCFDNNAIRKRMDDLFRYTNSCRNFLYLDSGNGAKIREGQTVMGYKQYGKVILKPVASCGIDNGVIRSNTEEMSELVGTCTRASASHPQNITTNILAARSLANHSEKVFMYREIHAHFSRFYLDPITLVSGAPIN